MSDLPNGYQREITAWAANVVRTWVQKMETLGIGDTGTLIRSFVHHVYWAADGNLEKIEFTFEYYGKFTEWGVGNGIDLHNRDIMVRSGRTQRRRKPWCSPVFFAEVDRLRETVTEMTKQRIDTLVVKKTKAPNPGDNVITI